MVESLKVGNLYRDSDGNIKEIEKIADGKIFLKGGGTESRNGLVWTGKKQKGQAIWTSTRRPLDKGSLGKISRTI